VATLSTLDFIANDIKHMAENPFDDNQRLRRRWMGVLAKTAPASLESVWNQLGMHQPTFRFLQNPECGLLMVRGRIGGTGQPFNLGEVTATRCTIRLESGLIGVACVLGRNQAHAKRAAIIDAMLQDLNLQPVLLEQLIVPLETALQHQEIERRQQTAGTKVDFFTMVRGD
jgi:alpha-D-ribose 1-methylphosphonate 5-triphosphate synthase subunit PhnG